MGYKTVANNTGIFYSSSRGWLPALRNPVKFRENSNL